MIHHLSLSAKEPRHVADVLSEIIGGRVVPTPPEFPADSWFVLSGDEHGTFIEVTPYGTEMRPGDSGAGFAAVTPASPYSASHALVSVHAGTEHILRVGRREGWKTERYNRGPFEVVECWLENRLMIEFTRRR